MKGWYLYVIVLVGGAAVLALEILGTRILGPILRREPVPLGRR